MAKARDIPEVLVIGKNEIIGGLGLLLLTLGLGLVYVPAALIVDGVILLGLAVGPLVSGRVEERD